MPLQVTERKTQLAQLESMDNGKPIDEAEWDVVSVGRVSYRLLALAARPNIAPVWISGRP